MGKKLGWWVAILPLIGLLAGCTCKTDRARENKALVQRAFDMLNNRAYDQLDQVLAQDYQRHCQATPDVTVESLDDFKALLRSADETSPDAEMTLDQMAAEGDLVAFWGTWSGTQQGPFGPFPATGKTMTLDFAGFHRIQDGKIAETWVTWDNLAALRQLGLFPPQGEQPGEGS